MSIEQQILSGPLPAARVWRPSGAGAVVSFEGVVRATEAGHQLAGLDYEVYEPMTSRQMYRLAEATCSQFRLIALAVVHSEGFVAVGACSFRLWTAAAHRQPALAAQDHFIDVMKREVPIWKHPIWASETAPTPQTQTEVSCDKL